MADIKFMDLSENDNPATTDSVLIGNADNGVKRTTLGKLGDMFAVHGLFQLQYVNVPVKEGVTQYPIAAPTVDGYTFAFWLNSKTVSWVASTYVEDPTNKQTNIWVAYPTADNVHADANGTSGVAAYAVYIKNSVA